MLHTRVYKYNVRSFYKTDNTFPDEEKFYTDSNINGKSKRSFIGNTPQ